MDSICKFIPVNHVPDSIQTVNFVYETQIKEVSEPRLSPVYRIHYVTEGTAVIQCGSVKREVKKGDIFFIFPSVPYTIEGDEGFTYLYVSYIGVRANLLMERLNINRRNFVFRDFSEVEDFWYQGILLAGEVMDMISESVLLYTLSKIGDRTQCNHDAEVSNAMDNFLLIKKYIDDNFSDFEFSLDKLSEVFSYNKKYISTMFKKHLKVGIIDYVNTVRINHACALIDQKYTGVGDIALLCGFRDPMYFSKVFKQKTGTSPKDYIKSKHK